MRIQKTYIAVGLICAFVLFYEIAAHANEVDQRTKITFTRPVQIPGQPAGTCFFQLPNSRDFIHPESFRSSRIYPRAMRHRRPIGSNQRHGDADLAWAKRKEAL